MVGEAGLASAGLGCDECDGEDRVGVEAQVTFWVGAADINVLEHLARSVERAHCVLCDTLGSKCYCFRCYFVWRELGQKDFLGVDELSPLLDRAAESALVTFNPEVFDLLTRELIVDKEVLFVCEADMLLWSQKEWEDRQSLSVGRDKCNVSVGDVGWPLHVLQLWIGSCHVPGHAVFQFQQGVLGYPCHFF